MKRMKRLFVNINLTSVFFIAVSFISGTLAWFAYSGIAGLQTEIDIKAWNIEINKNGEAISNKIKITMPQIEPGMEPVNEIINIKNTGDSDALVKFTIKNARILGDEKDNFILSDTITSDIIEDKMSHEYPFHINASVTRDFVKSKGGTSSLEVSVSWPLDANQDDLDSIWGTNTYNFLKEEEEKFKLDPNYSKRLPIEIEIELTAEQDVGRENSIDTNYHLGDSVFINPTSKVTCKTLEAGCIEATVVDTYNKVTEKEVNVIPNINSNLNKSIFTDYPLDVIPLKIEKILEIVSKDVINTKLQIPNLDLQILGTINNTERMTKILEKIKQGNVMFDTTKFNYLNSSNCIWLNSEYSLEKGFAIKSGMIYPEDKMIECNILPIITVTKTR